MCFLGEATADLAASNMKLNRGHEDPLQFRKRNPSSIRLRALYDVFASFVVESTYFHVNAKGGNF